MGNRNPGDRSVECPDILHRGDNRRRLPVGVRLLIQRIAGYEYGRRIQWAATDDGLLWAYSARGILPDVRLPRVPAVPPSHILEQTQETLIGQTLSPGGHCGELSVTEEAQLEFGGLELTGRFTGAQVEIRTAGPVRYKYPTERRLPLACSGVLYVGRGNA